jgi:hypothetical protein
MGSQGFKNIAGNPFVYQEDTMSAAMGLDVASQYWQLAVKASAGALPTDTAQITVNPAGNVRILPSVAGNVILDSVYYPKTVVKGDVLVASADAMMDVVAGATTSGYVLTANGAGTAPTFQAAAAGGIGTLAGDSGTATGATVTIAGTANQISTSATSATVTLSIPSSPSLAGTVTTATGVVVTNGSIIINNTAASTAYAELDFQKSRTGAAITAGDGLAELLFKGHDGTGFITASQITSTNSGTVATNRIASDLKFYTHPDSTTASTLRMTIASTGATTIASPDSGVGLTVSGGGITCTSGNIAASSGTLSASTTVTAGTNLVSTAGNLLLPTTSSTVGQITVNAVKQFHTYGTDNLFLGNAGNFTLTVGNAVNNLGIGNNALEDLTTAIRCCAVGVASQANITQGGYNCSFGVSSLYTATTSVCNMAIGYSSLYHATTGNGNNVAIGTISGWNLTTGENNVMIGGTNNWPTVTTGTGSAYTSSESNNILFSNVGVVGESNVIRIGTTGSGVCQQNKAYLAGTYGVTPGGTINVALVDSNGQLGSVASLAVAQGGTGAATLTDHGVLLGSGTGAVTPTAVGATGEVLIGNTGADASWSATPRVTSITFDGTNYMGNYVTYAAWTPEITIGGSSTGITYSNQAGHYTRIGNMVFYYGVLTVTDTNSLTGDIVITGLVVTVGAQSVRGFLTGSNITVGNLSSLAEQGTTNVQLGYEVLSGALTALTTTQISGNMTLQTSGWYFC